MYSYEIMLVLRPDLSEEALSDKLKALREIFSDQGAEVTSEDLWGKRGLAYRIGNYTEGFYCVWEITSESGSRLAEVDRALRLDDDIARFLLLRKD